MVRKVLACGVNAGLHPGLFRIELLRSLCLVNGKGGIPSYEIASLYRVFE